MSSSGSSFLDMQRTVHNDAEANHPAALSVAFIHPGLSTDPRILCAAACTCKAWREAAQQCSSCNTAVELSLTASLSRLRSFAQWLPKHAALVKRMTISQPPSWKLPKTVDGPGWQLHLEAAQQLLQQAMQLAEALPAAASAEQNTAAAVQQRICLPNISCITLEGSTGMLAALPARSLTRLELKALAAPWDGSPVSAALARLSNLQQLHVTMVMGPCSCLAGVAQLTRLTLLEFSGGDWLSGGAKQLRQLLTPLLLLRVLRLSHPWKLPPLNLSHLTQLQEFSCQGTGMRGAVFPAQLQRLVLSRVTRKTLKPVMQLQQLQRLTLEIILLYDHSKSQELLLRLAQLPALQQLVLTYCDGQRAAEAAPAWPQLKQLCGLSVVGSTTEHIWQHSKAILNGVVASTNLTKLELSGVYGGYEGDNDEGDNGAFGNPCAKLAGLTKLKDLCICRHSKLLAPAAALALTALTGLTRLVLAGDAGAAVGDVAATALAASCQQLRHLDLSHCNLVSMACLANVRRLTQLTELRLEGSSKLTQQQLMLLTGLKRLQVLRVDTYAEVTNEVMERFWAAVRKQEPQL